MQLRFLLHENAAHAGAAKALMDKFNPSLFAPLDEAALLHLLTSNAFVHSQQRPVQIRMVVYLLLWRHFRWAATDVCRFRITAALGYQRQQAEAIGLFWLSDENPRLGEQWLAIRSNQDGRDFHRATQRRLLDIIREHELIDAYEKGSATSLQVRFCRRRAGLQVDSWWYPNSGRHRAPARQSVTVLHVGVRIPDHATAGVSGTGSCESR